MNPLAAVVAERIRSEGPLDFATFMELALYHPDHGYYARALGRTGWRGHFLTSPELDPAFGVLWARGFREVWVACGSPERFHLVEIGPGEGALAEAVLDAAEGEFGDALEILLVEPSPAARDRQRARLGESIGWIDSLEAVPRISDGVVFANEVLDNLPVRLVEMRSGQLQELFVDVVGSELHLTAGVAHDGAPERFLTRHGITLLEGHRAEIPVASDDLVTSGAAILGRGALVFVDYGLTAAELATRPGGTLVSYSAEGVDDRVLRAPGERDITAHANWSAVLASLETAGLTASGPHDQRDVLRALGAGDLDRALRDRHHAALEAGRGGEAVAALSHRQALGALLDPGGLGGLQVVGGMRGIAAPSFLTGS